ncbi:MAG TPA: AtpZ/AtpI family protein [Syntrophomonadaceae bacterium]|nr:AtpZ/AtpI family protein [Syntrophomonadaceae bacterium]
MTQQNKNEKHWAKALSDAINLVTTIAAAVALCGIGGWWLDGKFGTDPWLTVIGVLLGVATGFKAMWDKTIADDKRRQKNADE